MPLLRKPEGSKRSNTLDIIGDPFYGENNEIRLKVLVHSYHGKQLTINISAESFYRICPEGKRILEMNDQINSESRTGIEYIQSRMHEYIKAKISYHKHQKRHGYSDEEKCARLLEDIESEINRSTQIQMQREESEDQSEIERKLKPD